MAEIARGARDEATTLDCYTYIIELWRETRFGFAALGIRSGQALAEWLAAHREDMRAWMAGDSRFRHLARHARAVAPAVGAYLQDYEQEFIIHQLTRVGANRFQHFGAILCTTVSYVAQNLPPELQPGYHQRRMRNLP